MKKVISLIVIGVLMFSAIGIMTGCNKDVYVEGKEWNYYKLRRGKDGVALTRLKDESLIVDGVLTIPTKVDGYKVTQLTGKRGARGIPGTSGGVFTSGSAEQIIIPEGIKIDQLFWHNYMAKIIIILDENPNMSFVKLNVNTLAEPITVVVPAGCYDAYYPKFSNSSRDLIELNAIHLIEYTEFKNK